MESHYRLNGIPGAGPDWLPEDRYLTTYTATGKWASLIRQEYITSVGWSNDSRDFFFYNSYDQLNRSYSETWLSGTWRPGLYDGEELFYYELYDVGISRTGLVGPQIRLSPVPANTMLTADITLKSPAPFSQAIINNSGQQLRCWSLRTGTDWHLPIDVADLPTGVYTLVVSGDAGKNSQQFVVTH
jgi:hypothetical protein